MWRGKRLPRVQLEALSSQGETRPAQKIEETLLWGLLRDTGTREGESSHGSEFGVFYRLNIRITDMRLFCTFVCQVTKAGPTFLTP